MVRNPSTGKLRSKIHLFDVYYCKLAPKFRRGLRGEISPEWFEPGDMPPILGSTDGETMAMPPPPPPLQQPPVQVILVPVVPILER